MNSETSQAQDFWKGKRLATEPGNCLILVPPPTATWYEHPGPARLAGYARSQGLEVDWIDLNVRAVQEVMLSLHPAGVIPEQSWYQFWRTWELPEFYQSPQGERLPTFLAGVEPAWFDKYIVLGFSCSTYKQLDNARLLAKWIRQHYGSAHWLVVGGAIFDGFKSWQKLLLFEFDAICNGEGEKGLVELLYNGPESGRSLHGMTLIHEKHKRSYPESRLLFDQYKYAQSLNLGEKGQYVTYGRSLPERGCYWGKCVFCNSGDLREDNEGSNKAKFSSISEVYAQHILELRPSLREGDNVRLVTDAMNPFLFKDILTEFEKVGLTGEGRVLWNTFMRSDRHLVQWPDFLQRLAHSGLQACFIGVESTSGNMMRKMMKGSTAEIQESVITGLLEHGIFPSSTVIPDHPWTLPEEGFKTIQDLWSYGMKAISPSKFGCAMDSPIYRRALQAQKEGWPLDLEKGPGGHPGIIVGDHLDPDWGWDQDPHTVGYQEITGIEGRRTKDENDAYVDTFVEMLNTGRDLVPKEVCPPAKLRIAGDSGQSIEVALELRHQMTSGTGGAFGGPTSSS